MYKRRCSPKLAVETSMRTLTVLALACMFMQTCCAFNTAPLMPHSATSSKQAHLRSTPRTLLPLASGNKLRSPTGEKRRITCSSTSEYEKLKNLRVRCVSTDEEHAVVTNTGRQLVLLLTHFGDLSSWEYAQQLRHALPALKAKGVKVVAVGIGGREAGKKFADLVGFPEDLLYYDSIAACCAALECSAGFGRESALAEQSNAASPYMRLLPMLVGIGSPGTLLKVFYGYFGDRTWNAEWTRAQLARTATGSFPFVEPQTFDAVGKGYLRPFELATIRLQNMIGILKNWFELIPSNADLVVQQGASLVLENGTTLYTFKDKGILVYAGDDGVRSVEDVIAKALS